MIKLTTWSHRARVDDVFCKRFGSIDLWFILKSLQTKPEPFILTDKQPMLIQPILKINHPSFKMQLSIRNSQAEIPSMCKKQLCLRIISRGSPLKWKTKSCGPKWGTHEDARVCVSLTSERHLMVSNPWEPVRGIMVLSLCSKTNMKTDNLQDLRYSYHQSIKTSNLSPRSPPRKKKNKHQSLTETSKHSDTAATSAKNTCTRDWS